jgi:toxin ParE1/3/4
LKILFTPTGCHQYLETIAYIHRDKPSAAVTFRQKAEESLSCLIDFPESGETIAGVSGTFFARSYCKSLSFFL